MYQSKPMYESNGQGMYQGKDSSSYQSKGCGRGCVNCIGCVFTNK